MRPCVNVAPCFGMIRQVMVATTSRNNGSPPAAVPRSALTARGGLVRFTVDDVLAMVRQGILPEDSTTELLNGVIVQKDRSDRGGEPLMHGPKHRNCVRKLTLLAGRIESAKQHGQVQLPVICTQEHMPEPDFSAVRGSDLDYSDRLPTAADVTLVIEAADSSLDRDRGEKLPEYAAAGIPQYLILNLINNTVELYSDPDPELRDYRSRATRERHEAVTLALPMGPYEVPAADLLP
jgi:hypothetical protein